jgi:hypothetical protein
MAYRTLDDHLFGDGPKRMLSLDGGGVRGALSLGYLARIEDILRKRVDNDPDFRLCDYFDLIGGTSTGSIIAAGLAMGMSVEELIDVYHTLGVEVFEESFLRFGLLGAKFPKEPLMRALSTFFKDETLGSKKLRTGLMVMTKRLDTGSPWLLHNNPRGKFYDGPDGVPGSGNRNLLIRNVIRASTAAPHYFEPELLTVSPHVVGAFVDGGISPYNNPSMQLLMMGTCSGYGLEWPFGEDQLLLVSVGTGFRPVSVPAADVVKMPAIKLAAESVVSIMQDANWLGQAVLQWMSRSPTAWAIDAEVGDLGSDVLGGGPAMMSYLRYELSLEPHWLSKTLGVERSDRQCDALYAMDNAKNLPELTRLGRAASKVQIEPAHFPASFDI